MLGGGLAGVEKLSNEGTWLVGAVWLEGVGVDNIPSTIAVAILSAAAAASEAPTITKQDVARYVVLRIPPIVHL